LGPQEEPLNPFPFFPFLSFILIIQAYERLLLAAIESILRLLMRRVLLSIAVISIWLLAEIILIITIGPNSSSDVTMTDWSIPTLLIASGCFVYLILLPKDGKNRLVRWMALFPIFFVIFYLASPDFLDDFIFTIFFTILIGIWSFKVGEE
jgi:hypothetical protein